MSAYAEWEFLRDQELEREELAKFSDDAPLPAPVRVSDDWDEPEELAA